jgi:hypothetical protein
MWPLSKLSFAFLLQGGRGLQCSNKKKAMSPAPSGACLHGLCSFFISAPLFVSSGVSFSKTFEE